MSEVTSLRNTSSSPHALNDEGRLFGRITLHRGLKDVGDSAPALRRHREAVPCVNRA